VCAAAAGPPARHCPLLICSIPALLLLQYELWNMKNRKFKVSAATCVQRAG
jgi:hypothetical protein